MKRITMLFAFLWTLWSYAQVKDYAFSQKIDTYSEITAGTILGNEASEFRYFIDPASPLGISGVGTGVMATGPGFPIGFDFNFNGVLYDRFGVFSGGWVSLGSSVASPDQVDMRVNNNLLPLNGTTATQPSNLCATIAVLANDLAAQTGASLRYQLIGASPNRTLVVQWKGYRKRNAVGDSFDFQIRLHETTNVIGFVYGAFTCNTDPSLPTQVGLRAAPTTAITNFVCRKSSTGWNNTVAGASPVNDKMILNNLNVPEMGLTFTWSPPTCGTVKDLVISNIGVDSAILNWASSLPTPSGYEYVVSTSSALPTGPGTATTSTTVNLSGLNQSTSYNVFMRSVCGSELTPWKQVGDFKTYCDDVTMLFENFDSYINGVMPDCWGKVIVSPITPAPVATYITSGSVAPSSAANRLTIQGNASTTNLGTSYVLLPAMSNIEAGTHRLKFKAYAENGQPGRTLDVGYYTNSNDVNTFQILETIHLNVGAANAIEYTITPPALAGVKKLGFRNEGYVAGNTATVAYVDDVIWEPKSNCPDVTVLTANNTTHVSTNISWTPGTTTAWQYAYSSPSVTNPYTLQGTDVTGTAPTQQITGLSPATAYKFWIRSKCATSVGAWIGPIIVETTCAPVAEFAQNFDLQTSGNPLPTCWRKVGPSGAVGITQTTSPVGAPSSPNVFMIDGQGGQPTIVALPPLSTAQSGTHQLKLKIRGTAGVKFDIGYLTDITNAGSFKYIRSVSVGTAYSTEVIYLGLSPKSPYLAFRNPATTVGSVFIDDVVWETLPACPEFKNFTTTAVNSTSASFTWEAAEIENQWQYVLGNANDMNPFILPVSDVPNPGFDGITYSSTINGLSPNSINKLWLRSKCDDTSFGTWVGPISVVTSCAPVTEFTQKFEMTGIPSIPSCWAVSGSIGKVSVASSTGGVPAPSGVYVLTLESNATNPPAVVAMPAASNTAAGTHRLTFKYRSTSVGGLLEVGYLLSIGEPNSFVPLTNFPCTTAFQEGIAEYVPGSGTEPASQILAFRNNGTGIIAIDDVEWAHVPFCENISNLAATSVTEGAIGFSWTKGASETDWQYAVGPATATSPNGLYIYDVSGTSFASATHLSPGNPLQPSTSYKIWVRSKCSSSLIGNFVSPITAMTTCTPVANFTENFATNTIPACWTRIGTKGSVSMNTSVSEPNDGFKLFMYSSSATDASIMALPPLSNAGSGDHILKFKFKGTLPGTSLEVGYLGNILDPTSFVLIDTFVAGSDHISEVFSVSLGNSPISNILAFRNPGLNKAGVLIDNVSWEVVPHVVPSCATNVIATPNANCGNYATVISWDAVPNADGYLIDISTAPGSSYVVSDQNSGSVLSFSFTGNYNTKYYYKVKPYNFVGTAIGCTEGSFTTNLNGCHCISVPGTNDGEGIVNVQLGASDFVTPDVTYKDFSAKHVNLSKEGNSNLKITFNTFYSYNTLVWIDLNDNFIFDASEVVFSGKSTIGAMSVLDASFNIPASTALGMHKLRIVTWPGTENLGNSCYNGAYGVTLDFNVNVVVPVLNDNPAGAISLVVGSDFAAHEQIGTNVNATGITEPTGCGNYSGSDVWYSAIVPSSGSLTFEINSVVGGLVNTAAAAYSGALGSLVWMACDDSSSVTGNGDHPKITLTGKTAGEVIYFRVWENGGDAYGAFKVSAYDSVLGVDAFDSVNFSYYPNPVKDILNLSFNQEMNNISVVNLLGQQVISKTLNANQGTIDMSGLSRGAYLVKVAVGNQSKTIKVIKE